MKRRGSWPRATEMTRKARTIVASAIRDDRSCSLLDAETERPRDVELDRPSSGGRVEPDAPAEEARWIERSEDEVRVRHRRGFAAPSVGRGPGIRAGALRADRERAEPVDPGDAAAAGADREDVALREVHGVSGRVATKPHLRVAVDDEAHIGGRAAHVEAEDAFASGGGADLGRANDPGRGPRGDERDRKSLRLYRPGDAPVRLYEVERRLEARLGELSLERLDVPSHERKEAAVHDRRTRAQVLPELGRDAGGDCHGNGRQLLAEEPRRLLLVRRVREREEEADRDGLDPERAEGLGRRLDVRRLERSDHLALGADSLAHFEPKLAGHEGRGLRRVEVVEAAALLGSDLEDISEARRRQQADPGRLSLDDRVRRHSRAVDEVGDPVRRRARAPRELRQGLEEPGGEVGGGARDLGDLQSPLLVEKDAVGERPAHVDARASRHGARA